MWDKIQIFGFEALWNPEIMIITIVLGLLYYLFTGPLKHKAGVNKAPTVKQKIGVYIALFLFYVVKGSPVYLLSHIVLMAHMIQMAIFYLLVPILIIRGLPVEWWRKLFNTKGIKQVLTLLTKPLIAIILFNGLFSLYHIPAILDFSKTNNFIHWSVTLIILFAAFCMWWPLLSPLKEQFFMRPLYRIIYIFGNGFLITPACALIIFADSPLYATYSEPDAFMTALALCVPVDVLQGMSLGGPQIFLNMPLVYDQQAAGIIMKVLQEVVYGGVLAKVFFNWYNSESREIDPLPSQQKITPNVERG
ncbi:cytochrome c oxidase assembly factor CtaG [Tenuibacillus multivorans]|uniref:Putative membrane protein n=1 Tax=Tenuibacillus multivorans TaxID=237069 RepID=A0A1G9YAV5_9BACI|nr:cytochrome c oxidase assembly factor CtaG [Tenuibacillus multivorans]GEL76001.1 cytochrome c oxidase assembly factor CtaG [Tenuibacillus multivorans]SDN05661.1 putative membrane protein [Tenuibacillus multivorans]